MATGIIAVDELHSGVLIEKVATETPARVIQWISGARWFTW
jgi:hypothetical protein